MIDKVSLGQASAQVSTPEAPEKIEASKPEVDSAASQQVREQANEDAVKISLSEKTDVE